MRQAHSLVAEHFYNPARLTEINWPARLDEAIAMRDDYAKGWGPWRPDVRATDWMLQRLEASHTALYAPETREWADLIDIFAHVPEVRTLIAERFPGEQRPLVASIGLRRRPLEIGEEFGAWFVGEVFPDSPAAAAGVAPGDRLLEPIHGDMGAPFESLFEPGEPVVFTLQRTPDPASRFEVTLTPRLVNPTDEYLALMSDSARIIEHAPEGRDGPPARIAYLRVFSWAGEVYQERLRELLLEPGSPLASADGLVLDIRGGWGGASPEFLSLFDPRMPAVRTAPRDGEPFTWSPSWTRPVTLLVDGGTRSGKEIIAYAFRKHAIGKVVGTRTAGAVLAGRPFVLSDGSVLYLAVSDVALDDGVRLEGVGVEPDVVVERDLPYSAGRDPQLEKAVEVCAQQVIEARARE